MSTEITKNANAKLPKETWWIVCIFSGAVGLIFGAPYRWPGMITACLGGLYVGYLWCWVMAKLYAAMKINFVWLAVIGIVLGVVAGIADGILLNVVIVYLVQEGYMYADQETAIPILAWNYQEGLARGLFFGAAGGFLNGLLWSPITAALYEKDKTGSVPGKHNYTYN